VTEIAAYNHPVSAIFITHEACSSASKMSLMLPALLP
jgi:hypothetical protein